jgi:tetratricopeptide (TPR) repeat protein
VAIIVALVIIIALLWPIFRRQNDAANSPTNEAAPQSVASSGQAADEAPPTPNLEIAAINSAEELFELGQQYYEQARWVDAVAAYQKVIELDSAHQAAYVNLGDTYYQQQDFDLAIEAYQQALELVPDDADVIYNLGATYFQQAVAQGEVNSQGLEKAITQIERAVELKPNLAEPYFALGTAHQLLGETDEAIEDFEKFLELDTGNDQIATETAQQNLEQLKESSGQ